MNGTHRLTERNRNTERTEVNQHVLNSVDVEVMLSVGLFHEGKPNER